MLQGPFRGQKGMLIMALNFNGIASWELLPQNKDLYWNNLKRLFSRNFEMWLSGYKTLLHNNAKPHTAAIVKDLWAEKMQMAEAGKPPCPQADSGRQRLSCVRKTATSAASMASKRRRHG